MQNAGNNTRLTWPERTAARGVQWILDNQERLALWAWRALLADAALMLALIAPRAVAHIWGAM